MYARNQGDSEKKYSIKGSSGKKPSLGSHEKRRPPSFDPYQKKEEVPRAHEVLDMPERK